jgi:ligand-binding SRPBCC domain-containing protein
MAAFVHTFLIQTNIDKVWNFYTDIKHLEKITPKEIELKIINTTSQNIVQGHEIRLSGKIFTKIRKRISWRSKITFLKQYEYVDEMLDGPFKRWKHLHRFQDVDGKQTEIIDEIEFELPYGIIGKLFEGYAYKQLQKTFEYRKRSTIAALV